MSQSRLSRVDFKKLMEDFRSPQFYVPILLAQTSATVERNVHLKHSHWSITKKIFFHY
jgi:hypothetical protein